MRGLLVASVPVSAARTPAAVTSPRARAVAQAARERTGSTSAPRAQIARNARWACRRSSGWAASRASRMAYASAGKAAWRTGIALAKAPGLPTSAGR